MRERKTDVSLERGLYVLRYESGPPSGDAPECLIAPSRDEFMLRVIPVPGSDDNRLSLPGASLVLVAYGDTTLDIAVRSRHPDGSLEANLRLESLGRGTAPDSLIGARPTPSRAPQAVGTSKPDISILLHLARRGDVVVGAGVWGAGPESPVPIEGLEIRWTSPVPDLDLEYQVCNDGDRSTWSGWHRSGEFSGTRGQALPLTGVRCRLTRAQAARFRIDAEALFAGGTVLRRSGQEIELSLAGAANVLIGLRLSISAEQKVPATAAPADSPKRVRVFRANRKQ